MTVSNAKGAIGFETMSMTIVGTDSVYAYGKDSMSRDIKVPLMVLPAKSPAPAPGDVWLISKRNGTWNFVGIKNNPLPPTITGIIEDGSALTSLIAGLASLGYVVNETTANEPWTLVGAAGAPAFQNGWVAYSSGANGFPRYQKLGTKVYLEGGLASGTAGAAAFTLPTGFRPTTPKNFFQRTSATGSTGCTINVSAAGVVTPDPSASNYYVSLDGIVFDVT